MWCDCLLTTMRFLTLPHCCRVKDHPERKSFHNSNKEDKKEKKRKNKKNQKKTLEPPCFTGMRTKHDRPSIELFLFQFPLAQNCLALMFIPPQISRISQHMSSELDPALPAAFSREKSWSHYTSKLLSKPNLPESDGKNCWHDANKLWATPTLLKGPIYTIRTGTYRAQHQNLCKYTSLPLNPIIPCLCISALWSLQYWNHFKHNAQSVF